MTQILVAGGFSFVLAAAVTFAPWRLWGVRLYDTVLVVMMMLTHLAGMAVWLVLTPHFAAPAWVTVGLGVLTTLVCTCAGYLLANWAQVFAEVSAEMRAEVCVSDALPAVQATPSSDAQAQICAMLDAVAEVQAMLPRLAGTRHLSDSDYARLVTMAATCERGTTAVGRRVNSILSSAEIQRVMDVMSEGGN